MPSHKSLLEAKVAEAEREHRAASEEEARIRAQVKETTQAIDGLTARLDRACLHIAQGNAKAEDPTAISAEKDRLGHKLRGLKQMHDSALTAHRDSGTKLNAAQSALQSQLEQEEGQRLEAAIVEAKAVVDAAKAALDEANAKLNVAAKARNQFLRKQELKARAKA